MKADSLIEKAMHLSQVRKDTLGIIDGYYYKGCLLDHQSHLDSAIIYLEQSRAGYERLKVYNTNLANNYGRLGLLYDKKNQYKLGLEALLKGLSIAVENKQNLSVIRLNNVLAMHHNDYTGNYKQAIAHLNKAEEMAIKEKESMLLGHIYLQYSLSYNLLKNLNEALSYTKKSAQAFQKVKSKYNLARVWLTQAGIFEKMDDVRSLDSVMDKLRPVMTDYTANLQLMAKYEEYRAVSFYMKKEYQNALERALACEKYMRLGGQDRDEQTIRPMLIKLYYLLGMREQGDSLFTRYSTVNDSVFSQHAIASDTEMRSKYNAEQQEKEIELQRLAIKNASIVRTALIGAGIFLLILAAFFLLRAKEKERASAVLTLKNEEIERKNELLVKINAQNETLLREIHHRVKNNLQMITSLFNMQSRRTHSPEALSALNEGRSRLKSIALIHNKLYQQDRLNRVNVQEYIQQLSDYLLGLYQGDESKIAVEVAAEKIELDVDTAVPLGLIVTELFTNSLKYAFTKHEEGIIKIKIDHQDEGYCMEFSDSGEGIPADVDPVHSNTLGLRLVRDLTQQLSGVFQYKNEGKAVFFVRFKEQIV
ncbi:sensor histidine kinase [Olivibacter sitiensis]|uniref:sensor histidine kinase n=1 Tax=Olivibacter sitiensis TaxID=376470 RepID=UPI000489FA09|nr:sensor histidine kinase [Olivibacter sitiensis]